MSIKNLVLSAGSYKGFYTIGVIKHLLNNNYLNLSNIENIYASSVGSIIGVLVCLKLDWNDIVEYVINKPWEKEIQINSTMIFDAFYNKGIFGNEFFENLLSGLFFNAKLSKNITFKELHDFCKIQLNIFTTNLTEFNLKTLNYKTTPDLKILEAIHMSCAIPFIFKPVIKNSIVYVDGGVINPYPANICFNDGLIESETLCINITDKDPVTLDEKSSILYYAFYLIFKLISINYNHKIIDKKIENEITIFTDKTSLNNIKSIISDKETRKNMIEEGINISKSFLITKQTQ